MATKDELKIRARQVENETAQGQNTASRIGGLFYDIVSNLLGYAPYTREEIEQLLNSVSDDFYAEIQTLTQSVNVEKARLTQLLATLNNEISNQVNTMFEDKAWLTEEMVGVQTESNFGDEDVDKYLQRIGVVERNEQGEVISWGWSEAAQTADTASSKVNRIEAIPGLPDNFNTYQSNILQTVDEKDDAVKTEISNTYTKSSTTEGVQKVIEWMYSGLKTGAAEDMSWSDLIAAGTNGVDTALSNFHNAVIEDANGRYTSTASVQTIVNDSISGLVSQSTFDETTNTLSSSIGENSQALAALQTKVVQLENGDYISTNSLISAITEEKDGIADVLSSAGLVNTATLDEATAALNTQIEEAQSTVYANVSDDIAQAGFLVKNDDTVAYIMASVEDNSSLIELNADQIKLSGRTLADTIEATYGTIAGWQIGNVAITSTKGDGIDEWQDTIFLSSRDTKVEASHVKSDENSAFARMSADGFETETVNPNTGTIGRTNKIASDGSGFLAKGNISWDTSGNVSVTAKVTAESGTIGGWSIDNSMLYSEIADEQEEYTSYIQMNSQVPYIYVGKGDSLRPDREQVSLDIKGIRTEQIGVGGQINVTNALNNDGSGTLGNGGISWDTSGNFTLNDNVVDSLFDVLSIEPEEWGQTGSMQMSRKKLVYGYDAGDSCRAEHNSHGFRVIHTAANSQTQVTYKDNYLSYRGISSTCEVEENNHTTAWTTINISSSPTGAGIEFTGDNFYLVKEDRYGQNRKVYTLNIQAAIDAGILTEVQ